MCAQDESSKDESSEVGPLLDSLPYHTLLCEILSSALGVTCCARILIGVLLMGDLSSEALARFIDELGL
jgi:hypothetical protein